MLYFLLIFLALFQSAISPGRGTGAVASSSAPTLLYSDNFSGTGALSANWTAVSASGYTELARVGGQAKSSPSGTKGLDIYTGGVFAADQESRATYGVSGSGSGGGATGVCVRMNAVGNGYCWIVYSQTIYLITGGGGVTALTTSCPNSTEGGIISLSVSGSTVTCATIFGGFPQAGAVSVTDSTYTTGYPGILVDGAADATNYIANWSGQ